MTVTPYSDNGAALPAPGAADQSSRGVARLVQWAEAADAAHKLAEVLCRTAFCPEQYREKPGEATAAILAGGEVGLSPFASLNAFDNIQGRAAPKAITLRAIVQSFGHEIEVLESTSTRCRMRGRRRGSEAWQTVEWGESRARQLGLLNKQQYRTQPTAMYLARCTSEISRLVAADAILGIGFAAEELEDMMAEQPTGPRKVQRQAARKAIPASDVPNDYDPQWASKATFPDDNELLGEGQAEPKPATPAQLKALGIQWSRIGVTDDLERHTLTGELVARDIGGTTKNLTVEEASRLIERLRDVPDRDALEELLRQTEQPELDWPPTAQPPDAE